jgi:hypothetical protein
VLFHLEVGNAVAQQAAGAAFALVDMDVVAGAAELLSGSHACRAGSDDRDLLAGLGCDRLRHDEAHLIGLVGNRLFDGLDRDRRVLEVERAGFLARRRDRCGR